MENMIPLLTATGLPGIVIVCLAFACRTLFNKLQEVQEKRIVEGLQSTAAVERNTAALGALTEVVKDRLKG